MKEYLDKENKELYIFDLNLESIFLKDYLLLLDTADTVFKINTKKKLIFKVKDIDYKYSSLVELSWKYMKKKIVKAVLQAHPITYR